MKILGLPLFAKAEETRSSRLPPDDDDFWYGGIDGPTAAGVSVNPGTAAKCVAVYACIRLLSETLASLPLIFYKRLSPKGKERYPSHPLAKLLARKPNRWMTSFEFREMMMGHLLLRGNAYAEIYMTGSGVVTEIVPLHPTSVEPMIDRSGELYYEYTNYDGTKRTINQGEMLHIKGLSSDGIIGSSVITHIAETIGLSLTMEEHAARFFSNSARPGGVLTHPGRFKDEDTSKRVRNSWIEMHSGAKNSHRVAILEEGMKWEQVGMSSEDAQLLESRRFAIEDIARGFRVPPHKIGDLSRATFSNIEHQGLEFVTDSLMPWLRRWEDALNTCLLSEREQDIYFSEFLVAGLLRGDLQSRYNAYNIGRTGGWLSVDEIRELENMNPLPDGQGETYLQPLNMQVVGEEPPETEEPIAPPPVEEEEDEEEEDDTERAFTPVRDGVESVFAEILSRAVYREIKARSKVGFDAESLEFYEKHLAYLRESLRTSAKTYMEQVRFTRILARKEAIPGSDVGKVVERCLEKVGSEALKEVPTEENQAKRAVVLARFLREIIEKSAENGTA